MAIPPPLVSKWNRSTAFQSSSIWVAQMTFPHYGSVAFKKYVPFPPIAFYLISSNHQSLDLVRKKKSMCSKAYHYTTVTLKEKFCK